MDFELLERYRELIEERGYDSAEAEALRSTKLDDPIFLEHCDRLRRWFAYKQTGDDQVYLGPEAPWRRGW